MGYDWQFTPDGKGPEAGRRFQWPPTPSLPNRFYPGYFKASAYDLFLEEVSGLTINNPDVVTVEQVAAIAQSLRLYYAALAVMPEDAYIDYPAGSSQPVTYQGLRDLVTIFEFAAQHQMCAIGY
jgi:hypothetical protein